MIETILVAGCDYSGARGQHHGEFSVESRWSSLPELVPSAITPAATVTATVAATVATIIGAATIPTLQRYQSFFGDRDAYDCNDHEEENSATVDQTNSSVPCLSTVYGWMDLEKTTE